MCGGRPAAFFTLLKRITSARSSSSVQSVWSVSRTSRWFSSIGILGALERGNRSGWRLPPPGFLLMQILTSKQVPEPGDVVDPPAQPIVTTAGFPAAERLLSGAAYGKVA